MHRSSVRRARLGLVLFLVLTALGWGTYQVLDLSGTATLAAPLDVPTPTLAPGTGAVVGMCWQDLNGNGSTDPDEPPLPGMVLTITSQDQAVRLTTTSDTDGSYRFDALVPGFYTLAATPPSGHEMTTPSTLTLFVGSGTILMLNFGARLRPTITPTATPVSEIDVGSAAPAVCGSVIHANNRDGTANVDRYSCFPAWSEDGPELVYRVDLTRDQLLTASLITTTVGLDLSLDLDLFLLTSAYPNSCVAAGDNYLTYEAPPATYYLVVDGYEGATGAFDLKLTCPLEPVQATPTPTYTSSPTPTATPTFTPSPTPTSTMPPTPSRAYLPVTLRQPTPTPTATPTPTRTATPTPTPTPLAQQRYAMPGVFWRDIHFVGRTGYAVGGPDWGAAGNVSATLIKTTDGGLTWIASSLCTASWMAGLDCEDANTCWIAGRWGSMRRTTDGAASGCNSWQNLNNPQSFTGHLVSAKWTGNGNTVLFGGSSGNVLRAADGYTVSVLQTGSGTDQTDFACPVAGTCYAAASSKGVLISSNNGLNWTLRSAGAASAYFNSVACTSVSTCWIAGRGGMIYRTTDGGITWQPQSANIPSQVSFNRVRMADAQHGYAVGCSNWDQSAGKCAGAGAIYRTTDGVTWAAQQSFSNSDLMDLYLFSMTDVFIVDWGGTVWHYSG